MEAKIAEKLGDMMLVRKTLETDWAWRVAAYTARQGLKDDEIQAVLRGPLAMPCITELVTTLRESAPGDQAKPVAAEGGLAGNAETQERERGGSNRAENEEAERVDEAMPTEVKEVKEVATASTPEELPSGRVVHLSQRDGARDDAEVTDAGAAQE